MNIPRFLLLLLSLVTFTGRPAVPLMLHPDNPHYFLFRGQPTIIITSGEHYGAVLNLDFDYASYLAELEFRQLNGTRTFSGAYFEPQGAFNIAQNSMAPADGRYIGPWPRTGTPGATHGGNKFDLSKWNDAYFARLRDFVRQASQRGVIVEMNLFCPFYEERQWKLSPMNSINNINNVGGVDRTNVYTMDKNGGLLPIQEALVKRIILDLNQFDNLYYEICNEPYFGGVTMEWQHHIADVIVEAERPLPNKHLISQNIANGSAAILNPHPAVSIFNFHYAAPPDAVAMNTNLMKVIGDNETGFRGTNNLPYRREAWEFIMAGGGLFNNLDYSFTAQQPRGTFVNYPANQPGSGNPALREQFRFLKNFMARFDFLRMQPTTNLIKSGLPVGMSARVLTEPDTAWAVYLGPAAPVKADKFSVRWTGKLRPPRAGNYTIYTVSNDGVRLSLDGQLLIDNWQAHSKTQDVATINLKAGKLYNLAVEYFQAGGNAVMQLGWSLPGTPQSIIPANRLFTAKNTPGLDAIYFVGQNFETPSFSRVDPNINFDWSAKSPFEPELPPNTPRVARLEVELPTGTYTVRWVNTLTGAFENVLSFGHRGGTHVLPSPAFLDDVALEIRRTSTARFKTILDISP